MEGQVSRISADMVNQTERTGLIRAKLDRAQKHIRDLGVEVATFMETKPYTVGVRTEYQRTVYYLAKLVETPSNILAITGDVLFNLRAALDHLAYWLAETNNADQAILRRISFPIFDDSAKYNQGAGERLKGLDQNAVGAINAIEPYNGGKGYLLWQLHKLNNIDKHRLLITVGCHLTGFRLHTTRRRHMHKAINAEAGIELTDDQADELNPFLPPDGNVHALKEGVVLVKDLFANEEVDQSTKFTFVVALNEPLIVDCKPLLPVLNEMADCVDAVITNFEPLS